VVSQHHDKGFSNKCSSSYFQKQSNHETVKKGKDKWGVKGEPSQAFKKRLRALTKRDTKQILLVICEIVNNSKHYISREFDRFPSGLEAHDFLLTQMSP